MKEFKKELPKKTKKEIVKMLLKKNVETNDNDELIDMLLDQPLSIDVDKQIELNATRGDKLADKITAGAGSWTFIIIFLSFILFWILLNVFVLKESIDPYPFILLNLLLSCVAALQAPVIMMSQNRQSKKDSLRGQNDYKADLKSELILEDLHDKMDLIIKNQHEILKNIKSNETK